MTLMSEMGGSVGLPTDIIELPNIWFELRDIISDAEHEIEEQKDGRE